MLKVQKQLQKGFTIIELLIVIAIIGILATLVLTNFQGAQAKGRDSVRQNDINSLWQKLEEYAQENGGYPDTALSATVLPGTDAGAFLDADDDPIGYTGGFIISDVEPTNLPTNDDEYLYIAYDCDAAGQAATLGATCAQYTLRAYLERGDNNLYEKDSLN